MTSSADTARELTALVSRLRRRLRDVSGLDGLTPSQTSVISRLDKDGPATTSDLARAERVRPQSMATTVAALEQRGLVAKKRDDHDARRQLVTLSGSVNTTIETSRRKRRDWLAALLDERLDADQRRTVAEAVALLQKVIDE